MAQSYGNPILWSAPAYRRSSPGRRRAVSGLRWAPKEAATGPAAARRRDVTFPPEITRSPERFAALAIRAKQLPPDCRLSRMRRPPQR